MLPNNPMWEFFARKKETPAAPVAEAAPVAQPEAAPVLEQAAEHSSESANEKYATILSQAGPSSPADPIIADVRPDAEKLGQVIDATSRVNQLVELAQVKGVAHAVEVARKMNDLYVLDTMHDELADKLYEALKAKGLIQGE